MSVLSRVVLFLVVVEGDEVTVEDQGMSSSDLTVLETVRSCGYGDDVFIAYMAEMYPYNIAAPEWRRASGTRNGVWVSVFMGSVPGHDNAWIELANSLDDSDASPMDKVMLAWLKGELVAEDFNKWPGFQHAISLTLERKSHQA